MNEAPEDALSQCEWILSQLKAGRKLTALECLREFGIFRTAARIENLRALGHQIVTDIEPVAKANGKTARVGVYRLVQAGEGAAA